MCASGHLMRAFVLFFVFMDKIELNDFYNDGFGWICRACELELKRDSEKENQSISRLMREGEAESKQPKMSNQALAKWADPAQRTLQCPRCGITETVEKF